MKNRIIYLLSTTVVILLAVFFLPVIAGKPLLDWKSLQILNLSQQETNHLPTFTSAGPSEPTTVYRWKEHDNTWHFSSTPPPPGARYETVIIDDEQTHAVLSDPVSPKAKTAPVDTPSIPSLYSPAEIARILKEAKKAQKQMQEHQEKLDAVFDDTRS